MVAFASLILLCSTLQAKPGFNGMKPVNPGFTGDSATVQNTITGMVTDDNGTLLPGASVRVMGSSRGTTTDFDGKFTITASEGDVLEVTYVGFAPQQVTVTAQDTYDVQLEASASELDEVLVTTVQIATSNCVEQLAINTVQSGNS